MEYDADGIPIETFKKPDVISYETTFIETPKQSFLIDSGIAPGETESEYSKISRFAEQQSSIAPNTNIAAITNKEFDFNKIKRIMNWIVFEWKPQKEMGSIMNPFLYAKYAVVAFVGYKVFRSIGNKRQVSRRRR